MTEQSIAARLKERGQALADQPPASFVHFTGDEDADRLLSDLDHHPHIFVLGCIMNQGISAERAWLIPVRVAREVGSSDFSTFLTLSPEWLSAFFAEHGLHRYVEKTPIWFYEAIHHIQDVYGGDATNIWNGNASSELIVRRFRQFKGAGQKISSMAANILCRAFKIPMSDRSAIDISPDCHTLRVFYRLELIPDPYDRQALIDKARDLNPEYPGIFDYPAFELGLEVCQERAAHCAVCYMADLCPKQGLETD